MILTRIQSFVGVLTCVYRGELVHVGGQTRPQIHVQWRTHDRCAFYLSVDRDTTSRYGKHYFRRKYESKSAGVPWLGQPSAKVPIINTFRHTDKNCTLDPFSMYKIKIFKIIRFDHFTFHFEYQVIDTPCTSRSTSLIILIYESSSFTRMAILSN